MENKKAEKADLEKQWMERFLLGLVFALALLFAGLEYTTRPAAEDDIDRQLDDLTEEMELMPAMDMRDMISATPTPASKALTEKVREVETPVEHQDKISPITSKLVVDMGGDVVVDAHETAALPQTTVENGDEVMRVVEQLPEFPGGMVEFMKWLTRNLRYPDIAQKQRIEGKVVVTFIVNKDGTIANPKVQKPVNRYLDGEALRVVRMMPKWKPGMIDKKTCRTMFAIPINFKL